MPIFPCSKCGCIENTATSRWLARKHDGLPALCSECDPDIGKWHGKFEKRSAVGMVLASNGYLYSLEEWEKNTPNHGDATLVGIHSGKGVFAENN